MLSPLPIDEIIAPLLESLRARPNAVVVAPPGAGKTTRLPPAVAELPELDGRQVLVLQPRRIAARAAAARIAEERGWQLGNEVGYQIRFDNLVRPSTRIRVMTEGILTRRIQTDPFLENVGCVILDEFHERSIHTDLALALLREIQSTVRPDLRVVVMSATMNPKPVAKYMGDAPVFESEGRLHPVDVRYQSVVQTDPVWDQVADAIREFASLNDAGHVLVFLPGMREIKRTQNAIAGLEADIHLLHSSISNHEQDAALRPSRRQKVILATNIAETSLTIDGVRTVIDSGLVRILVNDPGIGIDRLEQRRVSRASADQRAGRAGRTAPGTCVRLWTRGEHEGLADQELPEVQRLDLASTLLAIHTYGSRNVRSLDWFEAPPRERIERAEQLLNWLGALDEKGEVTERGRRMASLPVHPRIARLLLDGAEAGVLEDAATMAALLSERDILLPEAKRREAEVEGDSDVLLRMDLLKEGRSNRAVDQQAVRAVERVRDQLIRLVRSISKD